MPPAPSPALRERARRAVQGELVEVAQALFLADGYEATTVDAIADAAGMSRRTFFRYFASKEDLVLGKYDLMGARLVDALAARPAGEPVPDSLRRMFDEVVAHTSDAAHTSSILELERIATSTPALRAAYLARMDDVEERVAAVLRERAASTDTPWAPDDPLPRALVGSAFACFHASRHAFLHSDRSFAGELDRLTQALRTPPDPEGP